MACILFFGWMPLRDAARGDPEFQGRFRKAVALHVAGEFEEALSLLEQAISDSAMPLMEDDDRGRCLVLMGILSWDLGRIPESGQHFQGAERAFKKAGDTKARRFCAQCLELVRLYNQGKDARLARLFYVSLQRLDAAIALAREIGIPDLELKCLRQESLTYLDLRKLDLFLEMNQRALVYAQRINHRSEQGRCLNNVGVYYEQRHSYSRAVSLFEKALSSSRIAGDEATEAECLNNLGLAYRELDYPDLAQHYLSLALALDEKAGRLTAVCMDLDNIGSVYLRRGLDEHRAIDLLQALGTYQKSLRLMEQVGENSLVRFTAMNNIGIILHELRKHKEARLMLMQAIRIFNGEQYTMERGQVLNNIASTFMEERDISQAVLCFDQALELGMKHGFDSVVMDSCFGLGRCSELKGDPDRALSFYRRSITALERLQAQVFSDPFMIGFGRNKSEAYERAIDILIDRSAERPSDETSREIFDLIERAKARAFLENIYDAQVEIKESDAAALIEQRQAIAENIDALNLKLEGRKVAVDDSLVLKDELALEEDEYLRITAEVRARGTPREERWQRTIVSASDARQILAPDNAVLLEYFLGLRRSVLVMVTPFGLETFVLPARQRIESSLRGYLKWLSDQGSDPSPGYGPAERIAQELIPRRTAETIIKARAVVVIPDGILHQLPFETLSLPGSGFRYLIEHLSVYYCPSASALAVLRGDFSQALWKKELLAIGGPDYGRIGIRRDPNGSRRLTGSAERGGSFPPLPFSRREIIDVAGLFPSPRADVLVGEDARESLLKTMALKDYRRLHFACHGSVDEHFPLRSALVLSPENELDNDGLLQVREIYGLNLKAELVVLSACKTAHGFLDGNEGPLALARPFFFAGARSVVASLWQVNDRATVVLMHEFYRSLVEGRSEEEALRLAKLRMLRSSWKHPFYWAGFLLQGSPPRMKS